MNNFANNPPLHFQNVTKPRAHNIELQSFYTFHNIFMRNANIQLFHRIHRSLNKDVTLALSSTTATPARLIPIPNPHGQHNIVVVVVGIML